MDVGLASALLRMGQVSQGKVFSCSGVMRLLLLFMIPYVLYHDFVSVSGHGSGDPLAVFTGLQEYNSHVESIYILAVEIWFMRCFPNTA
jgi:hypothetical protein